MIFAGFLIVAGAIFASAWGLSGDLNRIAQLLDDEAFRRRMGGK